MGVFKVFTLHAGQKACTKPTNSAGLQMLQPVHSPVHCTPHGNTNNIHTLQSRSIVLRSALNVSASNINPSGWMSLKSKSFSVGDFLSRSLREALRLYVLPLRSYFSCIRMEEGRRLFITTNRIFFPPHYNTSKQSKLERLYNYDETRC